MLNVVKDAGHAFHKFAISANEAGQGMWAFAMTLREQIILAELPGTPAEVADRLRRSRFRLRLMPMEVGVVLVCMAWRRLVEWDGERWVRQ